MNKSGVLYKWSATVFIIGAVLTVVFIIADCLWSPEVVANYPLTLEYYPAFITTAGGVLFALILGKAMTASKQEKRMKQMQKILRKELKRMRVLVQPQKGNHLHT